jgi:hypothetical protein
MKHNYPTSFSIKISQMISVFLLPKRFLFLFLAYFNFHKKTNFQ